MRIACLHTHPGNIPLFEAACPSGMQLAHHVRSDLLARALVSLDKGVLAETSAQLSRLVAGSDAALLTCSVLRQAAAPPYFSADALLAEQAQKVAGTEMLEVFVTNPATVPLAQDLYSAGIENGLTRLTLIDGAWEYLLDDDLKTYLDMIVGTVGKSAAPHIALAQSSMAPAAQRCEQSVLCVPDTALNALFALHPNSQKPA